VKFYTAADYTEGQLEFSNFAIAIREFGDVVAR
jgi:hypothetical protein